ncbi:hypothetical protein CHU98_g9528 [Xylaria longipes]|nr:hypothetical protein CHU98_g9528 [Xylaria longipes]
MPDLSRVVQMPLNVKEPPQSCGGGDNGPVGARSFQHNVAWPVYLAVEDEWRCFQIMAGLFYLNVIFRTYGDYGTRVLDRVCFFKTLIDHEVTVELKNDIQIRGTLKSVDQYLNIKLDEIQVVEELKYPHLSSVKNVFIRGSVVRYVHLPAAAVDVPLLEDATRREAANQAGKGK